MKNWDRWRRDCEASNAAVDQFSQACQLQYGHSYEAGWWSSTVKRLLMEIPRARRETEIRQILDQAKKMEAEHIVGRLMQE